MDLLAPAVALVNSPDTPWLLAGGIAVVALWLWVVFRYLRLAPPGRRLAAAVGRLEGIAPAETAARYPELERAFAADPVLGPPWRAFAATLLPAEEGGPPRATSRPADHFHEASLIAPHVNLRFYQAVPNILVGAGLLLTFIGLVAALYFASRGVAATDVREAQEALRQLLHAATFKFVTSIAGLGASLVFSWREKHHLHRLDRRIGRLCALLEERLPLVTAEQLALLSLQEGRRQGRLLQTLPAEVGRAVARALEERLAERMAPLREGVAGAAREVTRGLGEELSGLFEGRVGAGLERLGATLAGLGERLEAGAAAWQSGGAEAGRELAAAAAGLNGAARLNHQAMEGLGATLGRLQATADGLAGAIERLGEIAPRLAATADSAAAGAAGLEATAGRIAELAAGLAESGAGVRRAAEALEGSNRSVAAAWDGYAGHFEGLDRELGKVFGELRGGLEGYTGQLQQFVGQLDVHLTRAVSTLGGVVAELAEAMEQRRP